MTTRRAPSKIIPRAFPGIKPSEIEELIANSQVRSYLPGEILCHEDVVEERFYMILEGDVEVTKNINNSEAHLLKTLGAGDFFGEMALIHNSARAATVRAKTPLTTLELDKAGFDRVLHNSTSVAMAMVSEISNRLRQNDQMAVDDLRIRASELADAYQKMAEQEMARREFLSNVAHELRTPLTGVFAVYDLLHRRRLAPDERELVGSLGSAISLPARWLWICICRLHGLPSHSYPLTGTRGGRGPSPAGTGCR